MKREKLRKKLKWALVGVGVVLGIILVAAIVVGLRYLLAVNSFLDNVATGEANDFDTASQPFLVYVSGVDSHGGYNETALSDVNIVVAVNPQTAKILLVSIPRDTYVQLHGREGLKDKLTHASIYGTETSKTTLEDLLGIKINYTVKVSFETVVEVVDEIGGIEIYSDTAMRLKDESGRYCNYVVGTQQVDGPCALRFARERKSYGTGDLHRGENQLQILGNIIKKITSDKTYLLKLPQILATLERSFTTSFSREDIMALVGAQLAGGKDWQIESISVSGTGALERTYTYPNEDLYVMYPDQNSLDNARAKIEAYTGVK